MFHFCSDAMRKNNADRNKSEYLLVAKGNCSRYTVEIVVDTDKNRLRNPSYVVICISRTLFLLDFELTECNRNDMLIIFRFEYVPRLYNESGLFHSCCVMCSL